MQRLPTAARSISAVLAVALLASCGSSPTSPSPSAAGSAADASGPAASDAASAWPTAVPSPAPGHELYGFVPYWEMDSTIAAHVAATPLSTLALFSVTSTTKGALDTRQTGYTRITGAVGAAMIAAAHGRGTRVELVFTSFGTSRNATFFAKTAVQDATIKSLVAMVGQLGVDGVDVDVEGLDISRAPAYGSFVGRLRAALVAVDASHTVSVATAGGPTGAAMAAAAVAAGADRVFLMGYDYRTATSSPGATSPIQRADGGRSLTYSLDLYAAAGIPPQRLLLGLPLYGMAWPVAGPVVGAPATGPGQVWILSDHATVLTNPAAVPATDQLEAVDVYFLGSDGSVAPPSAAASVGASGSAAPSDWGSAPGSAAPASAPVGSASAPVGSTSATAAPSAPGGAPGTKWTAVYVDSPATLAQKLGLAESLGLVGGGFWAIGYERGLPEYTALMSQYVAGGVPPS